MKKLALGILAHVDAGKTTLTEAMLYACGSIRKLGRVDHRDTFLDTDTQERERGITIYSKTARLNYKDTQITLIDTPGHTDFAGEAERVLSVLDAAVLVVSAPDGVQGHTLTLWKLLERYDVPTVLFVNKMDMPGTEKERLLAELKKKLSPLAAEAGSEDCFETAAMTDDDALAAYLDSGKMDPVTVENAVAQRKLFPVLFGSALKSQGTNALLDLLNTSVKPKPVSDAFSARVYKIARDAKGEKLTLVKVTGGKLAVRTVLTVDNGTGPVEEKVSGIRFYNGEKYTAADYADAGDVCALTGLKSVIAGDILGGEDRKLESTLDSVFRYRVIPEPDRDIHEALGFLKILEEEDPLLKVTFTERTREINVSVMGDVQLEILKRVLSDRFGMKAVFTDGSIIYKETIEGSIEGVGHYEPLRHYAEVHLLMEEAPRGSGITIRSAVSVDDLALSWQRLILTHIAERAHRGVLTGSAVTDMTITLVAGRAHLKHTEGGDFRQATYRAIRQGLMGAKSVLLEPWYEVEISLPDEYAGRAMTDITRLGGSFENPVSMDGETMLKAKAPVRKIAEYPRELMAYTRGRGRICMNVCGYDKCPDTEEIVAAIGYDPVRDIDNPASSVFCSHGAGTEVKWDEAPAWMHLPMLGAKKEETYDTAPVRRNLSGAVDDDQLMAIFERTYGKVERKLFDTKPAGKPAPEPSAAVIDFPKRPQYLLVDGYNIIFAWDELKKIAQGSIDLARETLVNLLDNYAGHMDVKIIVVFDAYKVARNPGSCETLGNIDIVYTREAQTADSYIEKLTYELSRLNVVRVATGDGPEQLIILGNGAYRMTATELKAEIDASNKEIQNILDRINLHKPARKLETAFAEAVKRKLEGNQ